MIKEVKRFLKKGHLATETGYYRQPDGKMVVTILTRIPGCKVIWVEWWFKSCLPQLKKIFALSNSATGKQLRLKQSVSFNNMASLRKYIIDGDIFRVTFDGVPQYIDDLNLKEFETDSAICGDLLLADGTKNGHVVHLARNTQYGCELRSRYWIDNCSDMTAMDFMDQNIEGLGALADFLRSIVVETNLPTKDEAVSCKFCYSEEIVKYGKRNNKQYWLCKKCGHFFIDNKALPKMRFPLGVVAGAVHDYTCGRSLNDVCAQIEKDTQILPSNSSIYRWINKFSP